jgi:hypothetical protein
LTLRPLRYPVAIAASVIALLAAGPAIADPAGSSGLQPVTGASKPPSEVAVVAAAGQPNHPQDTIVIAGVTGFLHHHDASRDFLWTRYDTGATTVVSDLAGLDDLLLVSAGGDSVATKSQVPSHPAPGKVSVIDLAHQSWQQWAAPAGYQFRAVYGSTMLVSGTENGSQVLRLVTFDTDGTSTTKLVTGLPAGATVALTEPTATNGDWAVVAYIVTGTLQHALLNVASGVATTIPMQMEGGTYQFLFSGDHLAVYQNLFSTVHVFSISGLTGGTDTTPDDVAMSTGTGWRVALAGDHVVASAAQTNTEPPALDFPVAGGGGNTILPAVALGGGELVQAADGSALVVGGSGVSDWAVHRFSTADDGSLADRVLPLRDPLTNAGLTLSQGLLRHVQSGLAPSGGEHFVMQNHLLVPASDGAIVPREDGGTLSSAVSCASGLRCIKMVDGNAYGVAYLGASAGGNTEVDTRIDGNTSTARMTLPGTGGRLVDASDRYVLVDTASPATQYVLDLGYSEVVRSGPITGAALWYSTLWTATTTAGQLAAVDLLTGKTTQTVSTGASCVPSEVQATGRWLYWSCSSGASGLVDLRFDSVTPLPHLAGPAMLGDGYLVWHDSGAGTLEMFDFHTGQIGRRVPGTEPRLTATPVKLASLPAGQVADDRGVDWAVDKYGADIAYVTADGAVHVVDTGVPSSPVGIDVGYGYIPQFMYPGLDAEEFTVSYLISRPVTSWTLTFTRHIGNQTVSTISGGPARTDIWAHWDGLLPSGAKAISGAYSWVLTVVPSGGDSPQVAGTGDLAVECGQFPFRSYGCTGSPALLAVMGDWRGESHWYEGTSNGGLRDNGFTEDWLLGSAGNWQFDAIVPFGDFDGDGVPDVLARDGTGVLHAYLGIGQTDYDPTSVKSITLGSGWKGYTLAAPGDLNRDGKPDLLARDSAGRLWLYAATGKGSMSSRVQVGSGWSMYRRLVGAGDLNGDGAGDLLAIDGSGVMWRYYGTGKGGLGSRVQVGSGWGGYNAVIGIGDLNLDGHNDLIARDSAGNLWEYPGNGAGGFGARLRVGTGFQGYQAIF